MSALTRAVAIAAALCVALAACAGGGPRPPADPVEAALRPYLREVGAEITAIMREGDHLGVYVRPEPDWQLDRYVTQLPLAAEAARLLLARFPELGDVDVCADGPWLPRPSGAAFATASRVQLYRDRLGRLPGRFTEPAEVLRAGLEDQAIDFYLDPRIVTGSAAYRDARRAA